MSIISCDEGVDQSQTSTGEAMSNSSPERNKASVLEAFETLFNKRDYAAAERFWSPNYIQHSAHIPPGREGLFALVKGVPEGFISLGRSSSGSSRPRGTASSSS